MADGVSVEVRGVAELVSGNATLADHIERGADAEFLRVADQAAALVRGRVPVDTGATQSSVTARAAGGGALVSMGDGVPYAPYEEYGGRGFPHTDTGNYLYPAAVEDAEPLLVAAGERNAERQIGAMHWPTP